MGEFKTLADVPTGFLIAGLDELVEAIRHNTEMQGLALLLKDAARCGRVGCMRVATWVDGCDLHSSGVSGMEMSIARFVRRFEVLLRVPTETP